MRQLKLTSKLFALIGILFFTNTILAQPTEEQLNKASLEEKFDAANELMQQKQFYWALIIMKNILKDNPDNANYNYKAGVCQLNQALGKKNALPYLEKAITKVSKKYDPFYFAEDKAPVETYYYLGKAYHLNYEFDKAIEMYLKFKQNAGSKNELLTQADVAIKQSQNAKEEVANPRQKDSRIFNLGVTINSKYDDYSPVLSLDENALYFTSRRLRNDSSNASYIFQGDGKLFEDIYVSFRDRETGAWGIPELVPISAVDGNEATIGVSADGLRLYVYRDDKGDGNIYFTEYQDSIYTELDDLGSDINSTSWETHVTVTADGNTLYFVSDRPGGIGGRDIYRCNRLPNGKWSKALNVGPPVNTVFDEDAPFISPGGTYLYFSSNSEKSMGGFDIMVAKIKDDGTFDTPENIGYPINSLDDDVFFISSADGQRGYFSSFRDDTFGEKDIYVVEFQKAYVEKIAILKGYILPAKGQELPQGIQIFVTDLTEGAEPQEYRPRPQDGSYVFTLIPCHEYLVDYQLEGSSFHQYQFQVPCESAYQVLEKVLNLDPVSLDPDNLPEGIDTRWQIRKGNKPYSGSDLSIEILDETGNVLARADISKEGTFILRMLESINTYIFTVNTKDPAICDKIEIVMIDEKNKVVGKTVKDEKCKFIYKKGSNIVLNNNTTNPDNTNNTVNNNQTASPAEYQRFYTYNRKGVPQAEKDFKNLINAADKLIKVNGIVKVEIESSASKVPTSTFKSNEILSKSRLDDGKKALLKALKAKGIDIRKVQFISETYLVLGPDYNNDAKTNMELYEKYQYIKIKVY
jgi:hypothetical protein